MDARSLDPFMQQTVVLSFFVLLSTNPYDRHHTIPSSLAYAAAAPNERPEDPDLTPPLSLLPLRRIIPLFSALSSSTSYQRSE